MTMIKDWERNKEMWKYCIQKKRKNELVEQKERLRREGIHYYIKVLNSGESVINKNKTD